MILLVLFFSFAFADEVSVYNQIITKNSDFSLYDSIYIFSCIFQNIFLSSLTNSPINIINSDANATFINVIAINTSTNADGGFLYFIGQLLTIKFSCLKNLYSQKSGGACQCNGRIVIQQLTLLDIHANYDVLLFRPVFDFSMQASNASYTFTQASSIEIYYSTKESINISYFAALKHHSNAEGAYLMISDLNETLGNCLLNFCVFDDIYHVNNSELGLIQAFSKIQISSFWCGSSNYRYVFQSEQVVQLLYNVNLFNGLNIGSNISGNYDYAFHNPLFPFPVECVSFQITTEVLSSVPETIDNLSDSSNSESYYPSSMTFYFLIGVVALFIPSIVIYIIFRFKRNKHHRDNNSEFENPIYDAA